MVRQPKTTPRSLTFGWNEIKLLPISKCPVPDTLVRDQLPTTMASVFSSFSLSLLLSSQNSDKIHTTFWLLWNKVKISKRGWVEQVSIVRKFVKVKIRIKNNLRKWMGVEDKVQGPKNQALGNTEVNPLGFRGNVYSEGHIPVSNVGA